MSDLYFDDEELEKLVKRTIKEELEKRAKADRPETFFEGKVHDWLDTEITAPEEEEEKTLEDRINEWNEYDRKPPKNAFGNVVDQDEIWNAVREASTKIYEEQQEFEQKQKGVEAWLEDVEAEIARNKKTNGQ